MKITLKVEAVLVRDYGGKFEEQQAALDEVGLVNYLAVLENLGAKVTSSLEVEE